MQNESDSLIAQIRSGIEKRINEQIEKHQKITPDADARKIIDIQMSQEKEKLEKLLDNEEDPIMADMLQTLIDWLPMLAKQLKHT